MIKTMMFAAALVQADINQEIDRFEVDKQAIVTQLALELNDTLVQITRSLVVKSPRPQATGHGTHLVEYDAHSNRKLTRIERTLGHL